MCPPGEVEGATVTGLVCGHGILRDQLSEVYTNGKWSQDERGWNKGDARLELAWIRAKSAWSPLKGEGQEEGGVGGVEGEWEVSNVVSPLVKRYELVSWDKCNPPFEMPYGGILFQTKPVTLEQ